LSSPSRRYNGRDVGGLVRSSELEKDLKPFNKKFIQNWNCKFWFISYDEDIFK